MADRKPLVIDDNAQTQQLQRGDNLKIPLEERMDRAETNLRAIARVVLDAGFELPDELTSQL